MQDLKITELLNKYGDDEKALIRDNPSLEVLYEFSNQRLGIIDWLGIEDGSRILIIGELPTVLKKYFAESELIVYDKDIKGEFDYVISIGSLTSLKEDDIDTIMSMLKTGGRFIAALDNKFGLRYLNGARSSESVMSRKEITGLLGEDLIWYYPMPDYRLPVSVYSDDYLPKQGDLASVVSAYNDAEFTVNDLGKLYDDAVAEGKFAEYANSFLVIKTK